MQHELIDTFDRYVSSLIDYDSRVNASLIKFEKVKVLRSRALLLQKNQSIFFFYGIFIKMLMLCRIHKRTNNSFFFKKPRIYMALVYPLDYDYHK